MSRYVTRNILLANRSLGKNRMSDREFISMATRMIYDNQGDEYKDCAMEIGDEMNKYENWVQENTINYYANWLISKPNTQIPFKILQFLETNLSLTLIAVLVIDAHYVLITANYEIKDPRQGKTHAGARKRTKWRRWRNHLVNFISHNQDGLDLKKGQTNLGLPSFMSPMLYWSGEIHLV